MKLPYRNRAFITPEKINKYLLSSTHKTGKYKAAFFEKIGFNSANEKEFKEALLAIAHKNKVTNVTESIDEGIFYGKKYEIVGNIKGPLGNADIKTIWIILRNKKEPKLVTVTPI